MSPTQRSAVRHQLIPVRSRGVESPKPGREGTTTSKASAGSPPWAAGSASGPITFSKSQKVQGQPWVRISGRGAGPTPSFFRKWIGTPSISQR